jgi:hypothetical protein
MNISKTFNFQGQDYPLDAPVLRAGKEKIQAAKAEATAKYLESESTYSVLNFGTESFGDTSGNIVQFRTDKAIEIAKFSLANPELKPFDRLNADTALKTVMVVYFTKSEEQRAKDLEPILEQAESNCVQWHSDFKATKEKAIANAKAAYAEFLEAQAADKLEVEKKKEDDKYFFSNL